MAQRTNRRQRVYALVAVLCTFLFLFSVALLPGCSYYKRLLIAWLPTAPPMSTPQAVRTAWPATETSVPSGGDTPDVGAQPSLESPATATDVPVMPTETSSLPEVPRMRSPEYGMQAFLWWRPETADRDLGLIRDAGFEWVKQDFAWRDIEGAAKGHFDWSRTDRIVAQAEAYGLKILVRIYRQPYWAGEGGDNAPPRDLNDFGDFCEALATRYRGRIAAYQIWNEPNLAREWGGQPPDPEAYVAMLKVAYERIKAADPGAIVISAGLSPTGSGPPDAMPDVEYLERMYLAGAAPYFDVLGVHAPGFKAPPELSPDEVVAQGDVYGHGRWFCFRHVEDLRAIMERYGDAEKQVAVLEMGWTTDPRPDSPYHWHAVTEEEQADYLVRAYQWAKEHWSPWIGLMSLIYVADPEWTPETEQYWWAITYPDYPITRVRPAYERLKAMEKH